ncbi:MAG: PhzF family phenazine biosynthesis protein [Nocardioidaceae bacterium]
MSREALRYTAFAAAEGGGNPAGVVLDARGLSDREMLAVAADVGYSETAFLFPEEDWTGSPSDEGRQRQVTVRYFSPRAEVPFCGHATIATAVALAERYGTGVLDLDTIAGRVPVATRRQDQQVQATLTSVEPSQDPLPPDLLAHTLAALGWTHDMLDDSLPPRVAFAGARHPVLAVRSRDVLAQLAYDYSSLDALMAEQDWTTMQLIQREADDLFHARDPFPPGGVVEDPATGAAAAAFGGYLRAIGLVPPSGQIRIHQGDDMGRPSLLLVDIPEQGGIEVTGSASQI